MTEPFQTWLDAAPIVSLLANTGGFTFWLDGAPIVMTGAVIEANAQRRRVAIFLL